MGSYEERQRREQEQQDQYYRMRPSLATRQDGRPNPYHQPAPGSTNRGSSSGGCFPAGIHIATPSGPRDISALRKGDAVICVDPATRVRQVGEILKVKTRSRRALWRLTFACGTELTTTSTHSFRTEGGWRPANRISPGQRVITCDDSGLRTRVVSLSVAVAEVADVYNLIVSDTFTFVADGVVAHSFTRLRTPRAWAWRVFAMVSRFLAPRGQNRRSPAVVGCNDPIPHAIKGV